MNKEQEQKVCDGNMYRTESEEITGAFECFEKEANCPNSKNYRMTIIRKIDSFVFETNYCFYPKTIEETEKVKCNIREIDKKAEYFTCPNPDFECDYLGSKVVRESVKNPRKTYDFYQCEL